MSRTPLVTILVPNYKTPELTKLCLRLLRKHTDSNLAKVIVIDNDSRDASTDYLRTLSWITLIERPKVLGESPPLSHSRALDLALSQVDTPYVLSIHTDTLVKNAKWLPFLLAQIESKPLIAGVGSWKLEKKSPLQQSLKNIEEYCQKLYYKIRGKTQHALEGVGKNYYYLRSHCALYRTALLRELDLNFSLEDDVAGKVMHKKLIDHGYEMIFLPSSTLINYLDHVNHATLVLNPALDMRQRSVVRGLRRLQKNFLEFNAPEILNDFSLDH
jgi:GT2 family glycosyltransferase